MTILFASIFTGIMYCAQLYFAIWAYKVFEKKDMPVGWIAVSIHGIAFYLVFSYVYLTNDTTATIPILGNITMNQAFNYWSIALRTHTILFGISILWAQIARIRGNGNPWIQS